jgi:hypothetical protein
VAHTKEVAVPGTDQTISPLKSQNNAGSTKQEIEMPICQAEARGIPEQLFRRVKRPQLDCLAQIAVTMTSQVN